LIVGDAFGGLVGVALPVGILKDPLQEGGHCLGALGLVSLTLLLRGWAGLGRNREWRKKSQRGDRKASNSPRRTCGKVGHVSSMVAGQRYAGQYGWLPGF
jgi:hypothetical protein